MVYFYATKNVHKSEEFVLHFRSCTFTNTLYYPVRTIEIRVLVEKGPNISRHPRHGPFLHETSAATI
jgi:hypothetical protein